MSRRREQEPSGSFLHPYFSAEKRHSAAVDSVTKGPQSDIVMANDVRR